MFKKILNFFFWKKRIIAEVQPKPSDEIKSVTFVPRKKPKRKFLGKCVITGKSSYEEKRCKEAAIRKTAGSLKIRAYKCQFCDYWHLTHKSNKLKMH